MKMLKTVTPPTTGREEDQPDADGQARFLLQASRDERDISRQLIVRGCEKAVARASAARMFRGLLAKMG
jgi:hypothetical protein